MFSELSKDLVVSCMDGFNVYIFAYGQIGSGKTFTMEASVMFCMTSMKRVYAYSSVYVHVHVHVCCTRAHVHCTCTCSFKTLQAVMHSNINIVLQTFF